MSNSNTEDSIIGKRKKRVNEDEKNQWGTGTQGTKKPWESLIVNRFELLFLFSIPEITISRTTTSATLQLICNWLKLSGNLMMFLA